MLKTTAAVIFRESGGPEVLEYTQLELGELGDQEILIEQAIIGVNFIDTYYRSGLYPVPLPSGLGSEAAGVVLAVGKSVQHVKIGDRVAYATGPIGSYAKYRRHPASHVVKIPDGVSFETAASVLLKGLTVYYLFHETYPLKKDETILFHAAAGGLGLLACQWAHHLGVRLIGTVSSMEKAELILHRGAAHAIVYTQEDVVKKVSELTQGERVGVVYDSIGKETWQSSIKCLRPRGLMVSFGNASGPVTGVDLSTLAKHGSLYVTRPILGHYLNTQEKLQQAADQLFALVDGGVIVPESPHVFDLKDVQLAHRELANRKRTGGLLLRP